ncbi:MAG: hypothetical protein ACI87O_000465 [Planctomycetota bacterium]|jgi:hypothetical protein
MGPQRPEPVKRWIDFEAWGTLASHAIRGWPHQWAAVRRHHFPQRVAMGGLDRTRCRCGALQIQHQRESAPAYRMLKRLDAQGHSHRIDSSKNRHVQLAAAPISNKPNLTTGT